MLVPIILAVLVAGQLFLGLLLLLQGQRTKRTDQRLFATLAFTIAIWTLAVSLLVGIDSNSAGHHRTFYVVVNEISFILSFAIFLLVYAFSLFYPLKRKANSLDKILISLGVCLTALAPLPFIAGTFQVHGARLTYAYGRFAFLIALYAVTVVTAIFFTVTNQIRHTHDVKMRQQSRTLLIGIGLTLLQGVLFIVVLPIIFGQQSILYALGYSAPFYLLAFTGYGLLRQGLFNI
ncbi:MAG TPA: hypothetical protein VKQ34_05275, partial [Candidatus Saccharimonadales bacterium]|nr:hypothetical protein [Candidatus Saccharimonadales bacterium]